MKTKKFSIFLVALLLMALATVSSAGATNDVQKFSNQQQIISLFAPIDTDVRNAAGTIVEQGDPGKVSMNLTETSMVIAKSHEKNLDHIIDALEVDIGQTVPESDRSDLALLFVQKHLEKVYWDQLKKKMGVKEEDFVTVYPRSSHSQDETNGFLPILNAVYCPYPTLIQVNADVVGGVGLDGHGIPYITNGGNQLLYIRWNTGWPDKILCEVVYQDEDCVRGLEYDAAYDAERLIIYGTIQDTQGFYIFNPDQYGNRHIEFGNDWDNGCSYGTFIGQHGYRYTTWNPSTPIYISNVWNHAMDVVDRNPNMVKRVYTF